MVSSFKRFSGLCAVAVISCLSVASGAVTSAVVSIAAAVSGVFGFAADLFTQALLHVARRMPTSLTGPAPKRPAGTAVERQSLVPSTAYALEQAARRRPTYQPWRTTACT